MLMTALLSLTHLQQSPMAISQRMPEQPALEQIVDVAVISSSEAMTTALSLSPSTQACGAANNSRKSCGGTGRRELM